MGIEDALTEVSENLVGAPYRTLHEIMDTSELIITNEDKLLLTHDLEDLESYLIQHPDEALFALDYLQDFAASYASDGNGNYARFGIVPEKKPSVWQKLEKNHPILYKSLVTLIFFGTFGLAVISAAAQDNNKPPVAKITSEPDVQMTGDIAPLTFNISESHDPDGEIVDGILELYKISGDNEILVDEQELGGLIEFQEITFVTHEPGHYRAILNVTDNEGASSEAEFDVNVIKTNYDEIAKQYMENIKIHFEKNEKYFPALPRQINLDGKTYGDDNDVANNHENYDKDMSKFLVDGDHPVFYKVVDYKDTFIVQYWSYSAYNDWKGEYDDHEHDWEYIFVMVNKKTGKPMKIATSYHILPPNIYDVSGSSSFNAYVELGGHGISNSPQECYTDNFNEPIKKPLHPANYTVGKILRGDNIVLLPLEDIIDESDLDRFDRYNSGPSDSAANVAIGERSKAPWKQSVCADPLSAFKSKISKPLAVAILGVDPDLYAVDNNGKITGLYNSNLKLEIPDAYYSRDILMLDKDSAEEIHISNAEETGKIDVLFKSNNKEFYVRELEVGPELEYVFKSEDYSCPENITVEVYKKGNLVDTVSADKLPYDFAKPEKKEKNKISGFGLPTIISGLATAYAFLRRRKGPQPRT